MPSWLGVVGTLTNGMSIRARDYGISDEVMIQAVRSAHKIRKERFTILGEVDLSREAAYNALSITGIL